MVEPVKVKIHCGLGNQMFQYAAARTLALRVNAPLVLDTNSYDKDRERNFELGYFPIIATHAAKPSTVAKLAGRISDRFWGQDLFRESGFAYDRRFESISRPLRLAGYFQSWKYFTAAAAQIRTELTPPLPQDDETRALGEWMQHSNAISLHVRRGDYVRNKKNSELYSECSPAYYRAALGRLPAESPVMVFSDDPAWVRENLDLGRKWRLASDRKSVSGLGDLWLMTNARHHIIANSTFSWWGAWLKQLQGLTVAPKPWFRTKDMPDADLLPVDWLRLDAQTGNN